MFSYNILKFTSL